MEHIITMYIMKNVSQKLIKSCLLCLWLRSHQETFAEPSTQYVYEKLFLKDEDQHNIM
jgi:hypothetical protein